MGRASTIGLALFLLAACGDSTGIGNQPLVIQILDTKTEPPAKVSVTFQVSTQDGAPLPGLGVNAFEILDNGVSDSGFESSKAFQPKPGRFQSSVALLLDMSGSITGSSALDLLKTASGAFVDNSLSAAGVSVGVWWFDGGADIVQLMDFSTDAAALKAAINGLNSSVTRDNSTNLNGAIQLGIEKVEQRIDSGPSGVTQTGALVVFTDGTDQANRVPAAAALAAVAATEIGIYSIGLRGEIDEAFLAKVGRSGSAFADNSAALLARFTGIGDQLAAYANSFYVLAYCSPRRGGTANQLTIRVTYGNRLAQATTTYPAVNFAGGCTI